MGKIAIVFSGQGAQYTGMGKSLYEFSCGAKEIYDFAEHYRRGTMEQSFFGSQEELNITKNTQPTLYLVDLCSAVALKEHGIEAEGVAGFSLGEIAALSYGGCYSYEEGFEIVCRRAEFMQKAAEKCETAMAAVLKLDASSVEKICNGIDNLYPVNYNSPVQTVVAGSKEALEKFKEKAREYPCKVIDLAVSGAFHSPFMDSAAESFKNYISLKELNAPSLPIYANYTAKPYGENVSDILSKQMNNPVRWRETIENMIKDGYTHFIEAGAGKTLSGLIKKIAPDAKVYSVCDKESLLKTVEAVNKDA